MGDIMRRNSGLIFGNSSIVSSSSASGVFDLFDEYNYVKAGFWPYDIFLNAATNYTIYENTNGVFTLYVKGASSSMTLYQTISHITTVSSDFVTTNSTISVASETGSFTLYPAFIGNPSKTSKTFKVEVRTGSITGPVIWTSQVFTIPAITVNTFAFTTASTNEGTAPNLILTLGNCGGYTSKTISLQNSGTISSADVTTLRTSWTISTNSQNIISYSFLNDLLTEGFESLSIAAYFGAYNLGTASITVDDTSTNPTGTVTPNVTTVVEGNSVTFNVSITPASSVTLYYTINTVSGTTMTGSRFTDGLLSGSITVSSGAGSVVKALFANGIAESSVFTLSVRTGSTSGTIIATSSNITVTDSTATYAVASGNAVPKLGASSTTPWPPTTGGTWTSLQRASSDDASVNVPFPFTWTFNNTGYTSCYVGSNSYITFGSGSSLYSGLSASNPARDKFMMNAGDRSYQSVAYISTANYVRIRYEGTGNAAGAAVGASTSIYEAVFLNPSNFGGVPLVEFRFGAWANTGGVTGIYSSSAALTKTGTFSPAANTSVVLYGNSTGITWTANANSYLTGV
jgi:hypothetical protein